MSIKNKSLISINILLCLFFIISCSRPIFPVSVNTFYKKAESIGCEKVEFIIDDDYILLAIKDYAKVSKSIDNNTIICEFYKTINNKTALLVFNALKINSDHKLHNYDSINDQGTIGYSNYRVSNNEITYIIILVENTVLYIKTDNIFLDDANKLIDLLNY